MSVGFREGINQKNAARLCEWSNEKGKSFQEQWAGPRIPYPLTPDKLQGLENLFSIFDRETFIGVIQKVRVDKDNVHIGRFIIDPQKTGRGFGTEALNKFVDFIFEDENMRSVSLTVFDFNKDAKRLYEKLGFEIDETIERPKLKYTMRKHR